MDLEAQVKRRLARIVEPWTPLPPGPAEPPAARTGGRGFHMRLDRRAMRALIAIIAVAVVIAGWMWWQGRPRPVVLAPTMQVQGDPLTSASSAPGVMNAGPVVVHIAGAVRAPGLFTLPAGSRVDDAVTAAGGATSPKALASVNLARPLVDGEQIVVGAAPGAAAQESGVNLNSADAAAFEALPGVGPVLAKRIVDWRTANGPFRSVDELGEVSGIGDAIMTQLRTMVHV